MKPTVPLLAIGLLAATTITAGADENDSPPALPDPAAATTDAVPPRLDPAAAKPRPATNNTPSVKNNFENWNLEPSVHKAHLIMVARVANISDITIVEGAKTNKTFREYRFTPVRILKGLFQRNELAMTAGDLGLPPGAAALDPHLKEGEYRLLILVQQSGGSFLGGIRSFGCVTAAPGVRTFAQRVPLLSGPEDPLVGVVETLIKVVDSRSRRERAKLLVNELYDIGYAADVAAVPLLTSLQARADWAATDERLYAPVEPWFGGGPAPSLLEYLIHDPIFAVRDAAVRLSREMLATRIVPDDPEALEGVAQALRNVLESDKTHTAIRVAAIEALGYLLAISDDIGSWPPHFFRRQFSWGWPIPIGNDGFDPGRIMAPTYAESAAAATAVSRIADHEAIVGAKEKQAAAEYMTQNEIDLLNTVGAVPKAIMQLPLDAPTAREIIYIRAAIRINPSKASELVHTRLKQSIIARQSLKAEVQALGRLRSEKSLPLLIKAAGNLSTSAEDRVYIARALGRIGDDRAVPVLADWLREGRYPIKSAALSALETIDSKSAASAVRPLLDSEANLIYKLRIARLLARHGIDDGYALATEHLADQTAWATLVLIALEEPRAAADLKTLLDSSPARRWRAAALTALAATGHENAQQQLLKILSDDRHPLVDEAALAAGLSADPTLLEPLAGLVKSRNEQIAKAALLAIGRFLLNVRTRPEGLGPDVPTIGDGMPLGPAPRAAKISTATRKKLTESVSSLALDAYVNTKLRAQALAVAMMLGGESYPELLETLADRARLEGSKFLATVKSERLRLRMQ